MDTKCESKPSTSNERLGPPKPSQSVRNPRPGINRSCDDDNEPFKHMSKLPAFLQQMEKGLHFQEKALHFGVLDWRLLEKWKCNERMPCGKYPQKASSISCARIVQDLRKQSSSSHVPDMSSFYSANQAVPCGSRFGSPKVEKYAEPGWSNKGKETCNQEYQAGCRFEDHFHERGKFCKETNVCSSSSRRKVRKMEMMLKEETLQNSSYAQWRREVRSIKLSPDCHSIEPENIVLLKPNHYKRGSSESSRFTGSRTLLDGKLAEMVETRSPDFFYSQELKFGKVLVSGAEGPSNPVTSIAVDVDTSPSASESKSSLADEENGSPSSSLESSSKNQAEFGENLTLKGAPSPTRRFSFHLGRKSRSLSFKDNSEVHQFNSRYGSMRSRPTSSGADNFNTDETSSCSRARSSPLRRLLGPLLKNKGAHAVGTVSTGYKGSSEERKPPERPTTILGILQLSFNNGSPFLQLVVNNSSDILAATAKRLPASGRNDSCMVYGFYSFHNVEKKGTSWMNQGSRNECCNLGDNVVGQMMISGPGEYNSRECVLYDVDRGQVDANKELAAAIVGNPGKNSGGTVVILPGGPHGSPNKGTPSSLVSRWRYGGSCDCGGWDVGCKLRVLVDCRKGSHGLQPSGPSSGIDHLSFYPESGGEKGDKPIFMMKPLGNGHHSIELDPSSISVLEAFAMCVAHVTCLKFPEIRDTESPGPQHYADAIADADRRKTPTRFQEQIPAYITCPPLSPTGRI